jgi:molybdopterin molybdotransferase
MTILHPIAQPGCGCDQRDAARPLLSIDAALGLVAASITVSQETDLLPLGQALGRVLASPVVSQALSPPFDNSAMDGYAVASATLTGDGPWVLDVAARVPAGKPALPLLPGLQAARIFTGAPIPLGADAVVLQEDCQRKGNHVRLKRRPTPGLNIRRAGSEMAAGVTLLDQGRRLGPRELAVCAAAGAATVRVHRRLRVALLVTGDEVRAAGTTRSGADIWDVNTPMLTAELTRPDIDLVAVKHGLDSIDGLFLQMAEMAASADIVITTGGISVGEEDHVKPVLKAMGGEVIFSGVAIKPGKPVSFGRIRGAAWLGLPGNPLSAFVTWKIFGITLVRQLTGAIDHRTQRRHVVTATAVSRKVGRCELRPARIIGFDGQGREVAAFAAETHSSQVRALPDADGLIFLPADCDVLPAGALVEFQPFCQT